MNSIRALPRVFIVGADCSTPFEIPRPEFEKLHNVLRLRSGAEIGVMPNDGSFWKCVLDGRIAVPKEQFEPQTEPSKNITLIQALPKGDKIDDIIRSCTEIGVAKFILFPSDRTVVKWEEKKLADKIRRVEALAREAAETSFRMKIPSIQYVQSLDAALKDQANLIALSEYESVSRNLDHSATEISILVGPEGGWSPRESERIQSFAVTLGPRVLRTEHAGFAAASRLLIQ